MRGILTILALAVSSMLPGPALAFPWISIGFGDGGCGERGGAVIEPPPALRRGGDPGGPPRPPPPPRAPTAQERLDAYERQQDEDKRARDDAAEARRQKVLSRQYDDYVRRLPDYITYNDKLPLRGEELQKVWKETLSASRAQVDTQMTALAALGAAGHAAATGSDTLVKSLRAAVEGHNALVEAQRLDDLTHANDGAPAPPSMPPPPPRYSYDELKARNATPSHFATQTGTPEHERLMDAHDYHAWATQRVAKFKTRGDERQQVLRISDSILGAADSYYAQGDVSTGNVLVSTASSAADFATMPATAFADPTINLRETERLMDAAELSLVSNTSHRVERASHLALARMAIDEAEMQFSNGEAGAGEDILASVRDVIADVFSYENMRDKVSSSSTFLAGVIHGAAGGLLPGQPLEGYERAWAVGQLVGGGLGLLGNLGTAAGIISANLGAGGLAVASGGVLAPLAAVVAGESAVIAAASASLGAGQLAQMEAALDALTKPVRMESSGEAPGDGAGGHPPRAAVDIARAGGKHAGQLEQFMKQTPDQLQKTIRSFDKQIARHESWIADPASKVKDFSSLRLEHQENLIHHWQQDILRHKELKSIAESVLERL